MSLIAAYAVPHPPLLLPEVGRGRESGIRATEEAYRRAAAHFAARKPDTAVLVSPHAPMYADYFVISSGAGARGDMAEFGAGKPETAVVYDQAFVRRLGEAAVKRGLPAGGHGERTKKLDHGSLVPLHFFQEACPDFRVVRLGLSALPATAHYRLGRCVAETAEELGRRTVIIASGDLSHRLKADGPYGFAPEGPEFDRRIMAALSAGDFSSLLEMDPDLCEAAGECGRRVFLVMAGAFDGRQVKAAALSYEGPFGVGYGVCVFEKGAADPGRRFDRQLDRKFDRQPGRPGTAETAAAEAKSAVPPGDTAFDRAAGTFAAGLTAASDGGAADAVPGSPAVSAPEWEKAGEDAYIRAARFALTEYVRFGRRPAGEADLPPELRRNLPEALLRERAGAFVTLNIAGELRGCIGTVRATGASVLAEILQNAVSAAAEDPRFPPLRENELARLSVSVDVLGGAEAISSVEELDVRRYGVIVSRGARRGLLLPDLDGVDTPARQVEIALRKAGISPGEPYRMERFAVIRHEAGGGDSADGDGEARKR